MEIDPGELASRERYKLMIGAIVPRPIALVSTLSTAGKANLAPFSFFTGVGSDPMTLVVCPANDPEGQDKDTLRNCRPRSQGGTGEMVVNIVTEEFVDRMAATAEPLPWGESEFDLAGLTPVPSRRVAPPRVAESPVAFECRTLQVISLAPATPAGGNLVLVEVVHVFLDDRVLDDKVRIDPGVLAAVGRMGGFSYCRTRERFELRPGRAALEDHHPLRPSSEE